MDYDDSGGNRHVSGGDRSLLTRWPLFGEDPGQRFACRWLLSHRLGEGVLAWLGLQTNQVEGQMALEGEPARRLGNIGGPASAQYRDGEISQGCHDSGSVPSSYL